MKWKGYNFKEQIATLQADFYTPHPLLREIVQCIMVVHYKCDSAEQTVCIYPPTPQPSLFFYIGDRIRVKSDDACDFILQPESVVVGQQLKRVSIDINRNHKAVRVGFHPGGMFRLLGIPLHESIDASYSAEDIFGREITEVHERLHEAEDSVSIKEIVEQFLLKQSRRLRPAMPFDKAMLELLKQNGNIAIEEIASLGCLSLRQFERVSKARIGISPKLFARIVRFSKAYRIREEQSHLSWTQIAHECGYFDQMHFIKDFKTFAGITPSLIEKELERQPARMQAGLRL